MARKLKWTQHADLASAICQAVGLTSSGRGSVFSKRDREALLNFEVYEMEQYREEVKEETGEFPSWTDTYTEFYKEPSEENDGISERTLRRTRKHVEDLRRKGAMLPPAHERSPSPLQCQNGVDGSPDDLDAWEAWGLIVQCGLW